MSNIKTLDFVKQQIENDCKSLAKSYEMEIVELNFGEITDLFFNDNKLEFAFSGYVIYSDSDSKESLGKQFVCSYKTPKGYISSKKLPVLVKDSNNVTLEEAAELLAFNTDAVKNTFDPFYAENEAKRRNAAAWSFIASNHLQSESEL